jgi:hypothetical protein
MRIAALLIISAIWLYAESKAETALRLMTAENARLKAESAELQAQIKAGANIQAALKSAGAQRSAAETAAKSGNAKTIDAISLASAVAQANADVAQATAVKAKADAKLAADQVLEFEKVSERTTEEFRNGQYASFAAILGTLIVTIVGTWKSRSGIINAVNAGTKKSVEGIEKSNHLTEKIAASHEDMAAAVRGMKTALEAKQDR